MSVTLSALRLSTSSAALTGAPAARRRRTTSSRPRDAALWRVSAASSAATRGSARSSAAAAAFPFLSAECSGVSPRCSRGEGCGAGRRAPEPHLRAPYPIFQGGIHPRGREEEGDDGGVAIASRPMQRGRAILQGRGRKDRWRGGEIRGMPGGGDAVTQGASGGATRLLGLRRGHPRPHRNRGDWTITWQVDTQARERHS